MQSDSILKKVQTVGQLSTPKEAEKAIQATFETLSDRILGDEARHLADQLPEEIGKYLRGKEGQNGNPFSLQEFYSRVSEKENVEPSTAANHVRAVMTVVQEAVTPGEFNDIRSNLSKDYDELFAA